MIEAYENIDRAEADRAQAGAKRELEIAKTRIRDLATQLRDLADELEGGESFGIADAISVLSGEVREAVLLASHLTEETREAE